MMDSGSVSVRICIPCSPMRVTGVKRMLPARGKFLSLEPGNMVVVLPVRYQEPCAPIEQGQRFCRKIPDRKSTRLNSSHGYISYAVFCLKKKKNNTVTTHAS